MSIKSIKEIKRYVLALIEEYSLSDLYSSDDEDINKRFLPIINIHYQMLANQSPIIKNKIIEIEKDEKRDGEEYIPYSLGSLCSKLLAVNVVKSDYGSIDYYYRNRKIYVRNNFEGKIDVEYAAYAEDLSEIPKDKLDDTELDIDVNGVIVLCYHVASDILKTDVSANYAAFDEKAQKVIGALDIKRSDVIGVVKPLKNYGGL